MTLGRYGFNPGEGLYTDMNAIRRDEEVDNLHSMYVDQWDWEAVINKSDRTVETLKSFVERIYTAMKSTQSRVCQKFSGIENNFPEEMTIGSLTVIFLFIILFLIWLTNFQAWVSELTKIHFFRKLRLQAVRTDLNLISIRNFLIRNFLIQSAAVSVSQDCVCICLVRLI